MTAIPFSARVSFFCCILLLVAAQANADNSLTTTNGKKITGKLVSVDGQGVTFSAGDSSQLKVPAKDVLLVDLGNAIPPVPKDAKYHELELTDGSTFRISKFIIKGKRVTADLLATPAGVPPPTFELEIGSLFYVMRGADDPKTREAWKKLLANRGKRDMYVIREAEGLNFVQGTIIGGNEAGDQLTFEKEDNTKTELRLSRATGGLVFAQQSRAQIAPTLCKVLDVFGNVLVAQSLQLSASGVTVTTVNGVVVKYPSVSAVAKLDYGQGNVAYLSDLDPQVDLPDPPMDEKGLRLNVAAPFTRDVCVANEPLRLGGDVYPKGLTVAPDVRLTYTIGGDYREFKAMVGMQENTPDALLEARLTIETETGQILFSEVLRRKDKPRAIALDVKNVKQLRVSVDADLPVNGNRVVLVDARLQK
jgi:hypothetical protein